MIREIIEEAYQQSPRGFVLAILATIIAVPIIWFALVFAIIAGTP